MFTRKRAVNRGPNWIVAGLFVVLVALVPMGVIEGGTLTAVEPAHTAPLTGNWEQQAPYPTHFHVDGVDIVTPTEAWAVAGVDILHTTDGGATWESQPRPGTQVLDAVDFFDTQHGIAMGNTTLYTRDGGLTWTQVGYYGSGGVEMADANLAFIYDHRVALYHRSTDGGATWIRHNMPSNISSIQCFDSLNCVASSPTGTYHSYDAGINWTFIPGQGNTFESVYFINHNQGWYVINDVARRTTDGGATWQNQALPGGSWIYDRVFSDENNGWGVGDNMVRTTNGGATWQEVPLPPESLPLWDIDSLDAQNVIAVGDSSLHTEAVIITSVNGGATWTPRTSGSINQVLDMVALDRDHAWASHNYGGKTTRTTDGGRTWQLVEVGEQFAQLEGIDMADLLNGWVVGHVAPYYEGLIYRTGDGGASWQRQFDPGTFLLREVAALDAQTAIVLGGCCGYGATEHRTTDGGASWHQMDLPTGPGDYLQDVFFLDSETGWMVGEDEIIIKTTDGGDTWIVQHAPIYSVYALATVHFSDPNNGWAGGFLNERILRTTNGGNTWTAQNAGLGYRMWVVNVQATGPMSGWIAVDGDSGTFLKYTTDGGATWTIHTPQPQGYSFFRPRALTFVDAEYGWTGGVGGVFLHTEAGPPTVTPTVTPTITGTPPTATPTACPPGDYVIAQSTGASIVPGVTKIDDCGQCTTSLNLPFPFRLYEQSYNSVYVTTVGTLQFTNQVAWPYNTCLPDASAWANNTIFAYWDDLASNNLTEGIFTSTTGIAPNRIFNIEWRVHAPNAWPNYPVNFEVRLYENSQAQQFEIIYGQVYLDGSTATTGVQQGTGVRFTQFSCNQSVLTPGLKLTFTQPPCGSSTPAPTSTSTPPAPGTPSPIPTTHTPAATSTGQPTGTSVPATPVPTGIVSTATSTSIAPTTIPTACAVSFTDVPTGHTFHANIRCLACRGIISGYADGTFRPNNQVTRGQLAKMVSNAAGFSEPVSGQTFTDVPPTHTFYEFIERLTTRGYMTGYQCGGPGEPCINNMPYFRPQANATRGQTSKIVSNAAMFTEPPVGQTFQDVPTTHTFYAEIQRLASRNVMGGYPCGGPFEPCIGPNNRPYFRPGNDVTRGQSAKIVANTFYPGCVTP